MGSFEYLVCIKGRDVVMAALPVQEHWLPLSNLDLVLPPADIGVFFCYKQNNDGVAHNEITTLLKKALAQVLVTFYPFAGEMVENIQGEPELLCNNSGVDFLDAYADVQLKDLDLYHPDDSIEGKFVPVKKRGVLSVQVTELSCGGLILGCTFDHRVADAYSANMFFAAWAEAARLKQIISHIPSFRRSILNPNHPPTYNALYDDLFIPVSSIPPSPPCLDEHLQSRIYHILAKDVEHLQSQCNTSKGSKRSKLCSFTAFLWKIIAGGPDDTTTCKMGVVVDGRERLNEKLYKRVPSCSMDNYFGNVVSVPYGEATYGELKAMPVQRIADMVHGFVKDAATGDHFLGLIDWVELHRPGQALARIYCAGKLKENDGEAVVVSSGQRFPVDIIDFGWGRPEFGSYHCPWGGPTGYVMPMPSAGKSGDWVVYMHLLRKHLDLIEAKASHIFRPITPSYLNL